MSLHTAQHLLSAVLDTKSLPTLSWSMTAHPSLETPYVELPRALTWAEAQEVEDTCNRLIAEAKRVWIDVSVQIDGGETGDGDRESRGIPKDYAGVGRFRGHSSTRVPSSAQTTSSERLTWAGSRWGRCGC
jgi:alanyl-tRNA synthetase/misacylated tRNA(Ala) deacylase